MSDMTRTRWSTGIEDADRLARAGAEWIGGLARAVLGVLRVVTIVAALLGLLALLLTVAAADGDSRIPIAVVAGVICAVPAAFAWWIERRIRVIVTTVPRLTTDLRRVVTDPSTRQELAAALLQTDEDATRSGRVRLRHRVRSVWRLRRQVGGKRSDALDLWASILTLSRVPVELLIVAIGCAVLALWCLVALVAVLV